MTDRKNEDGSWNLLVSRHLYQESTEKTEIGYPVLNADGFCPGSFEKVK